MVRTPRQRRGLFVKMSEIPCRKPQTTIHPHLDKAGLSGTGIGQKVVLDTDLIIDHLRQKKGENPQSQLETVVAKRDVIPLISTVTIQELFAGQSSRKTKEEQKIRTVLNLFGILPLSISVAEIAGKIIRDAETVTQFADSSIAATAIFENAFLLTKNKKDFQKIKGLRLYK